jgi:hypothetical protein
VLKFFTPPSPTRKPTTLFCQHPYSANFFVKILVPLKFHTHPQSVLLNQAKKQVGQRETADELAGLLVSLERLFAKMTRSPHRRQPADNAHELPRRRRLRPVHDGS